MRKAKRLNRQLDDEDDAEEIKEVDAPDDFEGSSSDSKKVCSWLSV